MLAESVPRAAEHALEANACVLLGAEPEPQQSKEHQSIAEIGQAPPHLGGGDGGGGATDNDLGLLQRIVKYHRALPNAQDAIGTLTTMSCQAS